MIRFDAVIKKFADQGEKTGWTYIDIPASIAEQLQPGNRKGFRVKGKIDRAGISMVSLLPMGSGNFIMPLNAAIRKQLAKPVGEKVDLQLAVDKGEVEMPPDLLQCLEDEPEAGSYFESLTKSHRNYFANWINSAKTEVTRTRRIADTVNALVAKMDYGEMIRSLKKTRD